MVTVRQIVRCGGGTSGTARQKTSQEQSASTSSKSLVTTAGEGEALTESLTGEPAEETMMGEGSKVTTGKGTSEEEEDSDRTGRSQKRETSERQVRSDQLQPPQSHR